jgi:hypothetical protein
MHSYMYIYNLVNLEKHLNKFNSIFVGQRVLREWQCKGSKVTLASRRYIEENLAFVHTYLHNGVQIRKSKSCVHRKSQRTRINISAPQRDWYE